MEFHNILKRYYRFASFLQPPEGTVFSVVPVCLRLSELNLLLLVGEEGIVMPEHKNDTLVVAAPLASLTEVERAGPAQLPDSTRYWKIEKQEDDLTGQLGDLEEGTRERNREFQAKLEAIEERMRRLEAGINQEIRDSEESHAVMFEGLENTLEAATKAIEVQAEADITVSFEPGLDEHIKRVEAQDAILEEFTNTTVPRVVDEQSGAVTRKLQKAHETFDIENAKIAKREQKLLARFATHVSGTAQSFEDEKATRVGKLWLLGEDLEATEHMDDRGDEALQVSTVKTIKDMRENVVELSEERERQDGLLLDSLAHAQQKLQRCILETFGTKLEDGGGVVDVDSRHGR
eukprot:jgi/Undpi1/8745/HiC_scaffold_25.g11207.m1